MFAKIKKEIKSNQYIYFLLLSFLAIGFFLQVYRVEKVLGFYFDQGRDAMVIWRFFHEGKLFLVGPTTGIAGIFRGPFYYFLILPFYFLGGGNPVWPAVFLSVTAIVAFFLMYVYGAIVQSRVTGLIAVFLASFSFYIVLAARWLSNPTPMLLLSMLLVVSLYLVTKGYLWAWAGIAFLLGASLFHFGSSGEFFYFPAVFIIALWQRKNLPTINIWIISTVLFVFTMLPLIIFDLRHDGILFSNIKNFLFDRGSFKASFWEVVNIRLNFYWDVFTNKLFHWRRNFELGLLFGLVGFFIFYFKDLWAKNGVKILIILLLSPMIGLFFFQGNYGNIYDYYMTGYYLIFLMLVAFILGRAWQNLIGKAFVILFLCAVVNNNLPVIWAKITDNVTGEHSIALKNELQAVDWVYQDAGKTPFNVDVYVPPVIPHAYDYLFAWRGESRYNHTPSNQLEDTLYTLYEVDPPHPERLTDWLERQAGIGKIEVTVRFGGITVERRSRIDAEEQ